MWINQACNMVLALGTLVTLFFTIYWRHCDTVGKPIAYIRCIDELMWLIVENTGSKGIEIKSIDTDEAIFCGTDIKNNIYQCKTWLEPGGKLRYLLGRSYIHNGGIRIKGLIKYGHKKQKIDIRFEETKASCNDYTIEGELLLLHNDTREINNAIENLTKQSRNVIHNSCDIDLKIGNKAYYIPEEKVFNFIYSEGKQKKIYVKNFMSTVASTEDGKKPTSNYIEFYCIDSEDAYKALVDWENSRQIYDIILTRNGIDDNRNTEASISFCKDKHRIGMVEQYITCLRGVHKVVYIKLLVS